MGSIARIAVALLSAVAVQFVAAENRIVRRHHEDSANKRRFEVKANFSISAT
ncbi:hypothetical protein BIW11_04404 [Tropilaelaps mercedesae]|uniref:Uncharacterized protein n=1 Tax=Tropilaelaps mercedesae TaxID=418985 RepID=A0A1V9X6M6_9ACAR|nr:hypothetical protein BIW11_04404 [Tropilaelaps mercedesae]